MGQSRAMHGEDQWAERPTLKTSKPKGANQMAKITDEAIKRITELVNGNLDNYQNEIQKALDDSEDGQIKINCPIKLTSYDDGGLNIVVGISFALGTVKDSAQINLSQKQLDLF
jgi:hypothetical protein